MAIIDIQGQAVRDFYEGLDNGPLMINNHYGAPEEMPIEVFFRSKEELSELDQYALSLCDGDILDVGAGAGAHSIVLQQQGENVTALDQSPAAVDVMKLLGVKNVVCDDVFNYSGVKYDTLLLLMNGIGLVGKLEKFPEALSHFITLLKPGGQLIFDSSNIDYLYEGKPLPQQGYYGELSFQFEYGGSKGEWFDWLYIDPKKMAEIAMENGWLFQELFDDGYGQYLARIIPVI